MKLRRAITLSGLRVMSGSYGGSARPHRTRQPDNRRAA
jgi:hypothetical protein